MSSSNPQSGVIQFLSLMSLMSSHTIHGMMQNERNRIQQQEPQRTAYQLFNTQRFYHQYRYIPPDKAEIKQLCGQHLRYAIAAMCRSRGYFGDSVELNLDLHQVQINNSTSSTHHKRNRTSFHSGSHLGKQLPVIIEAIPPLQRRLPRQVVDECCEKPCKEEAMLKYCGLFRQAKHITRRVMPPYLETRTETPVTTPKMIHHSKSHQELAIKSSRLRPWKSLRRNKNKTLKNQNDHNSRNHNMNQVENLKLNTQFATFTFFILPIPCSRRPIRHQKDKPLGLLYSLLSNYGSLRDNAYNAEASTSFQIHGILNISNAFGLYNFDSSIFPSLQIPRQWSKQNLLRRLLKTRDTNQIPNFQYPRSTTKSTTARTTTTTKTTTTATTATPTSTTTTRQSHFNDDEQLKRINMRNNLYEEHDLADLVQDDEQQIPQHDETNHHHVLKESNEFNVEDESSNTNVDTNINYSAHSPEIYAFPLGVSDHVLVR